MSTQQKPSNVILADQSFEPYIGPRSFKREIEDRLRFFGRDAETKEIVSLIMSHRLSRQMDRTTIRFLRTGFNYSIVIVLLPILDRRR
jgi:hypothetical protein